MKRIYLVFSETKDGKHFAHAETIRAGENLKNYIERYPSADIIHICESATQAAYLAEEWNDDYRRNKTYMFQSESKTEENTFEKVMAELKCLAEENPPDNANYWLEENRVNIFGYIEDNGNDDRWIALLLEIHGDTFESIEYGTDEVDENELAEKVREILNDYNEKWRIQK